MLEPPPIYTKSKTAFWNDDHISRQMLRAHLDPDFEGASRKLSFIESSSAWINRMVPSQKYPHLLDIGCGPGIYAERFAGAGYQVTGIDFSDRSVEYARWSAGRQGLDITYLCQDYLEMELDATYDFATMIYCDYGALSAVDRRTVMEKIYRCLRPGGKFLLDVFAMEKYSRFQEEQTWEICCDGGFWREQGYLALTGHYRYAGHVTLEQIAVFTDGETAVYYLWNTCFTKKMMSEEAEAAGFRVCEIFGDVAGAAYGRTSPTMALLLEK